MALNEKYNHVRGELKRARERIKELEAELARERQAKPSGYEHYTPATVEAIRGTTMTHADRQNKTQDEVFREAGR